MDYDESRRRLVEALINEGILKSPWVIEAMRKVPRERFVLPFYRKQAYSDHPLPSEGGQTISAPHMVAIMTELLDLKPGHKVLDIGSGTGYHAAVMAEIVGPEGRIYGVEVIPQLVEIARDNLKEMGYENIEIHAGDGSVGMRSRAPFDRILVACAPPEIPPPLVEQLKDGGKMVIPVGVGEQRLMLVEKNGGEIERSFHGHCIFVPMKGRYGARY